MPKCLKGLRMETKKCGRLCTECKSYEPRSKKEIVKDELKDRQMLWIRECYDHSICNSCLNFNKVKAMCKDMLVPAGVYFECKPKHPQCKLPEVFIAEEE